MTTTADTTRTIAQISGRMQRGDGDPKLIAPDGTNVYARYGTDGTWAEDLLFIRTYVPGEAGTGLFEWVAKDAQTLATVTRAIGRQDEPTQKALLRSLLEQGIR